MSLLEKKSNLNESAAQLLIENNFNNSTIHCFYYSCFQLMMHIWIYRLKKSQYDLGELSRTYNLGSHETLINQIRHRLKQISLDDSRDFNKLIGQLKLLRIKADYEDNEILDSDVLKSIELKTEIITILKQI